MIALHQLNKQTNKQKRSTYVKRHALMIAIDLSLCCKW